MCCRRHVKRSTLPPLARMAPATAPLAALVETDPRSIVDVNVIETATIGPDTAAVVAFEPVCDGAVFAARRMEIDRTAGSVIAAPAGSGDARAAAIRRDDSDAAKLGADLVQALLQYAW